MREVGWSLDEVARNVAEDIPSGSVVIAGIGPPTRVSDYLLPVGEVTVVSENGVIGVGPRPPAASIDDDLIDAGKDPITLIRGGAICDHLVSFAVVTGGRLDLAILGCLEVSERGDLASWDRRSGAPGSVGGAMDIARGARRVWIMTRHLGPTGAPRLVKTCSLPLTASRCVAMVYSDLGTFEVGPRGFVVKALCPGVSREELQRSTAAKLHWE